MSAAIQNNDLEEEVEAINAIYGPDTMTVDTMAGGHTTILRTANILDLGSSSCSEVETTVRLQLPNHDISFIIGFEKSYPESAPRVLGTASTAARGNGKISVDILNDIICRVYQIGAVCMFDVISDAAEAFEELNLEGHEDVVPTIEDDVKGSSDLQSLPGEVAMLSLQDASGLNRPPEWVLSDVITEKKSVFLGRVAPVTSLAQAQGYLDYLLAIDKKVAAATHNISAWRIRPQQDGRGEATIQDFDDDGETAAGGRLLHLMQLMDVWDAVVVVSRWYGGVKLGPDRFRVINSAGKDALMKGGYVRKGNREKTKGKGKKGK